MAITNTNEQPDYAKEVADRLATEYKHVLDSGASVRARLRELPKEIEDESTLDKYATLIREGVNLNKRIEVFHSAEKAPYLGGGRGCDNFFFGEIDKLARRKEGNPPGALDIANARVDDFMQKKLAAARAERERIAAEERRKAEAEQARIDAARRAAEEAATKAARARNEENIAAHRAEAERQAKIAEEGRLEAERLAQAAEDARIDTKASAADMTRTRLDSGAMATMGTVPFVKIDDATKLDMAALWPFIKEEHLLMALKAWAKTKSHKTPMAGATIELRNKGRVT